MIKWLSNAISLRKSKSFNQVQIIDEFVLLFLDTQCDWCMKKIHIEISQIWQYHLKRSILKLIYNLNNEKGHNSVYTLNNRLNTCTKSHKFVCSSNSLNYRWLDDEFERKFSINYQTIKDANNKILCQYRFEKITI